MLATLAVLAIGYRYWSAFLAAKALALSDAPPLDPRHLPSDREAARQGVTGWLDAVLTAGLTPCVLLIVAALDRGAPEAFPAGCHAGPQPASARPNMPDGCC